MFKLIILVFAALSSLAAARLTYLTSSPLVYYSHYIQPAVRTHYNVPLYQTLVRAPVVQAPVVHSVNNHVVQSVAAPVVKAASIVQPVPVVQAAPVYHTYGAVPVVKSYAPVYAALKKK